VSQSQKPNPRAINRRRALHGAAAIGLCPDDDDSGKKGSVTITKAADGEGKFIRQSAGRAQHGHVIIKIEPNERGKGILIRSDVSDGTIPEEYIKPVTEGIREALDGGVYDERPIVDIRVHIVGGSSDQVASNELAFKMAGIFAIKDAIKKAEPIAI
jgi:elongation factor G